MSLSYAARLKKGVDYGVCGLPELSETPRSFHDKASKLVEMIKRSEYLVIMTGAGISTSTGIPDFRGPSGVWTKEQQGTPFQPQEDFRFEDANPSLTHMAILGLLNSGKLKYLISQNVDGLHLRSGIPKDKLSELHGNIFIEECRFCKKQYFRDFDVQSIGLKETGRKCKNCGKALYDVLLDWDDALPEEQLSAAEDHSRDSDLMLCLGTSLKVQPANKIPLLNQKHGGKMALCNLQQTPVDKKCHLVIHAKCDALMQYVMNKLGILIPVYTRNVTFVCRSEITEGVIVTLTNPEGLHCPYILELDIEIVGNSEKTYKLNQQPFKLILTTDSLPNNWKETLELSFTANFARGCSIRTFEFKHKVNSQKVENTYTVEITRIDYNIKKDVDLSVDLSMDDGFYELRSGKRSPLYKNLMPDSKKKKGGNGGGRPKKKVKSETEPMEESPSAEELKREQDIKTLWELFPEKKQEDIIVALDATRNSISKAADYLLTKTLL